MQKILKAEISDDCGLTKSVRRVFEFRAVGKTNQEIATILYRSIKTIDSQTRNYLRDLEVKNTNEAIAKTVAEGWLTFKYITKATVVLFCLQTTLIQVMDGKTDIRRTRMARRVTVTRTGAKFDYV